MPALTFMLDRLPRRAGPGPEAGLPLMNAPQPPSRPRHVQLDPATLRPSKPASARKGDPAKGRNDAVATPLPTNLPATKGNTGPFTSDIPPSRPARTNSFPAKNGAGQGWKVENDREYRTDGLLPTHFFAHTACPDFADNVIVEASHHLRKMQAHCSWLHLFEHARWLHAGLSASPARLCSRARDIPAHASLAYSYQRSAGPTIPIKSRMESNSRISNECTTT